MRIFSHFICLLILSSLSCGKKGDDNHIDSPINPEIVISASDSPWYNNEKVTIGVSASVSIKEVNFYFNGSHIGGRIMTPWEIEFIPVDMLPDVHEIIVKVKSESGTEYQDSINVSVAVRLGDDFLGGRIFHIDDGGKSGLIAFKTDLQVGDRKGFTWGPIGQADTDKTNGYQNTLRMSYLATADYQAGYHFPLNLNGYDDWYIPAIEELEILKENKHYVGGFSDASTWEANFWSSSELSVTNAEALHFNVLTGNSYQKNQYHLKIRPIRKF